jgi:hypothetical protein
MSITLQRLVVAAALLLNMACTTPQQPEKQGLFLERADVPKWLVAGEDRRKGSDDAKDYADDGVTFVGFRVWAADNSGEGPHAFTRIVDVRYRFESEIAAKKFFKDRARSLAEGVPPAPKAAKVGDESAAFFGVPPIFKKAGLGSPHGIYVVRVGAVVIKLYASLENVSQAKGMATLKRMADRAAARAK